MVKRFRELNQAQLIEALAAARVGKIIQIVPYAGGQHNRTFFVITSKGKFSLRVYLYKTPSKFSFELALLNAVRGLPVPRLQKFGRRYYYSVNDKFAILYRYIPGHQLTRYSNSQLTQVGSFIGSYHRRVQRFVWHGRRHKFYDLPKHRIQHLLRVIHSSRVPYQQYLRAIVRDLLRYQMPRDLPEGSIHADIKPENTLFYGRRLSGVIDFDNSYIGPFILDLAKSMVWFGSRNGTFRLAAAIQIYRGYVSKRPLNAQEFGALFTAVKFAFLSHVFVDYFMRARSYTTAKYFSTIIRHLYTAYRTFTIPSEEFYRLLLTKKLNLLD